jgi:hypothetical protein
VGLTNFNGGYIRNETFFFLMLLKSGTCILREDLKKSSPLCLGEGCAKQSAKSFVNEKNWGNNLYVVNER